MNKPKLELTLQECKAIKSITYNQYIHYENTEANDAINKIYKFIEEQDKPNGSQE